MHAKSLQSCLTPCDTVDCMQPPRILCWWDSPGKNTGVGCHALLQGIFLTQGSNLCLLHVRALAGGTTWEAPKTAKYGYNAYDFFSDILLASNLVFRY